MLAACGNDSKGAASATGHQSGEVATSDNGFVVVQRFSQDVLVPGQVRLPISLADKRSIRSDGPDVLDAKIYDTKTGKFQVAASARKRRVSKSFVYWDFHVQLDTAGTYALVVNGGTPEGGAIQVNDPQDVTVPLSGQTLAPFDTPTTDDHRGVNPICTRLEGGPCPFHSLTLTAALQLNKPVAYLVGTPAHCQFGTCAPGLEFLINASKRFGDKLVVVHAEVYTDDSATVPTPAVQALNIGFEPVLFLTDAAGKVVKRLDAAWDQSELDETLNALLA